MLEFALIIYFFVYLFKDAEITKFSRKPLFHVSMKMQHSKSRAVRWSGLKFEYWLGCAFCQSFLATLIMYFLSHIPFEYVLTTPPICLIFDSIQKKEDKNLDI